MATRGITWEDKMTNVYEVDFKRISDKRGCLTPVEYPNDIPFEVKRIYYIYDVLKDVERGFHSHRDLEQILIVLGGSVTIRTKTPEEEEIHVLDAPDKGLYIGPYIWREMFDFSENSTLLVLASNTYNEKDYIRNYDEYKKEYEEMKRIRK